MFFSYSAHIALFSSLCADFAAFISTMRAACLFQKKEKVESV